MGLAVLAAAVLTGQAYSQASEASATQLRELIMRYRRGDYGGALRAANASATATTNKKVVTAARLIVALSSLRLGRVDASKAACISLMEDPEDTEIAATTALLLGYEHLLIDDFDGAAEVYKSAARAFTPGKIAAEAGLWLALMPQLNVQLREDRIAEGNPPAALGAQAPREVLDLLPVVGDDSQRDANAARLAYESELNKARECDPAYSWPGPRQANENEAAAHYLCALRHVSKTAADSEVVLRAAELLMEQGIRENTLAKLDGAALLLAVVFSRDSEKNLYAKLRWGVMLGRCLRELGRDRDFVALAESLINEFMALKMPPPGISALQQEDIHRWRAETLFLCMHYCVRCAATEAPAPQQMLLRLALRYSGTDTAATALQGRDLMLRDSLVALGAVNPQLRNVAHAVRTLCPLEAFLLRQAEALVEAQME